MAQVIIEQNNGTPTEALNAHFPQHKNTSITLEFYDLLTELTLKQIHQRDTKRSKH